MKFSNAWPSLWILPLCLSACSGSPRVEYVEVPTVVYPAVPALLAQPVRAPDVAVQPMQIEAALDIGAQLRVAYCGLYGQYRQLMAVATNGGTMLPVVSHEICPDPP